MADIEIRRKKKFDGDEDPIVTAQRFLNIFHQLHIFNDQKKTDFNTMILKQPSAVLSMLNTLPGGGMLLDYVEELENKSGVSSEHRTQEAEAADMSEEVSKAKILATALAEAQIQAHAKMQAAGSVEHSLMAPQYVQQVASTPSKVEMGEGFTKDLAGAIAQALASNNNQQRDDIKGFVQTLGRAQLDVIKLLQEENSGRKQETLDLAKMLSESQQKISDAIIHGAANQAPVVTPAPQVVMQAPAPAPTPAPVIVNTPPPDFSELIKASQQQTQQIIQSLNENRRADNMELATVMKESQLEIAKMLIQNNTIMSNNNAQANNNANNIQINTDSGNNNNRQLEEIITKLAQMQSVAVATPSSAPQIIFDMSIFEKMLGQLVSSQSQLYREIAATQTKELSAIISVALKESQAMSVENIITAIENLPQQAPTQIVERIVTVNSRNDDYNEDEDDGVDEDAEEVIVPLKKKKKRKKKKNSDEVLVGAEAAEVETIEPESVEIEAIDELKVEVAEHLDAVEPEVMEDEQYIYVEAPIEEEPEMISAAEPEPMPEIEPEEEAKTVMSPPEAIMSELEAVTETSEEEVDFDLDAEVAEVIIDDKAVEDWGWATPVEAEPETVAETVSTTGLEWEYEEESAPAVETSDTEQDWEWEYEEVPEEESLELAEPEQDWVWEYEEAEPENVSGQSIGENSPIYSHELFFQPEVLRTTSNKEIDLPIIPHITIKNLENRNAEDNPYQDCEVKD